jgi:hypothetical protein
MKYLGVAVLGTNVLGTAVLGVAVLQPQKKKRDHSQHCTRSRASSHIASQTMESHRASRCSIHMKYLGVAVLGVGVLGVAVLGTVVLHPQMGSLSTQHSLTRLFPQSISNHGVA